LRQTAKRRTLTDPAFFVERVLGYKMAPFHRVWFEFQMRNPRTLILAPRGHGKTTICNIAYTLWRLVADPDIRALVVCRTAAQAQDCLFEMRLHLEANTNLTPLLGGRGTLWQRSKLTLPSRKRISKEPTVTASGVLGPIVGKHFDLIVMDDVVDERNSATEHMRDSILRWFRKVLLPCLEPNGELHILGTRYHPNDLYQHIIDGADEVVRLNDLLR